MREVSNTPSGPFSRSLAGANENLQRELELCERRWEVLAAGLLRIQRGNWNHGNLQPGLTVMQYAKEVLEESHGL